MSTIDNLIASTINTNTINVNDDIKEIESREGVRDLKSLLEKVRELDYHSPESLMDRDSISASAQMLFLLALLKGWLCDAVADRICNLFPEGAKSDLGDLRVAHHRGWVRFVGGGGSPADAGRSAVRLWVGKSIAYPQMMLRFASSHGWELASWYPVEILDCNEDISVPELMRIISSGTSQEVNRVFNRVDARLVRSMPGITALTEIGQGWQLAHITCTGNTALWVREDDDALEMRLLSKYDDAGVSLWDFYDSVVDMTEALRRDPETYMVSFELDKSSKKTSVFWSGISSWRDSWHFRSLLPDGFEPDHAGYLGPHGPDDLSPEEVEVEYWESRLGY